jgi:transcriptional regulator with XRE-family HTH domain
MEINAALIKTTRIDKGWTQQQLADIADVSLRTIQRIESTGSASNESVSALCSSFELEREELLVVPRVNTSELQTVRLARLYTMIFVATLLGCVLGALIMYWLMK